MNANISGTSYEPYWPIAADELINGRMQPGVNKGRKVKMAGTENFPHLNSALPVTVAEKNERKDNRRMLASRPRQTSVMNKPRKTSSTPGVRRMLERVSSVDSLQSF